MGVDPRMLNDFYLDGGKLVLRDYDGKMVDGSETFNAHEALDYSFV